MMKLVVQFSKETRNYVCYETPLFDLVFRSNLFAVKLWIPKSEMQVEEEKVGMLFPIDGADLSISIKPKEVLAYPQYIEVGILDESDNQPKQSSEPREMTLREIVAAATKET